MGEAATAGESSRDEGPYMIRGESWRQPWAALSSALALHRQPQVTAWNICRRGFCWWVVEDGGAEKGISQICQKLPAACQCIAQPDGTATRFLLAQVPQARPRLIGCGS